MVKSVKNETKLSKWPNLSKHKTPTSPEVVKGLKLPKLAKPSKQPELLKLQNFPNEIHCKNEQNCQNGKKLSE